MKHSHIHRLQRMMTNSGAARWFLAGGVPIGNCLGAWQPKGAASYAASKVSLVNPSAANLLVDGTVAPSWDSGIGWTFAGNQFLKITTALATATPLSMVCRFAHDNVTDLDHIMCLAISAGGVSQYFALETSGSTANDPVRAVTNSTTGVQAATTTGYTATVFYTGTAVFASPTSRSAYINGGSVGTNTTSKTPTGIDTTYIGCGHNGTAVALIYTGKISACAFYSIALSDAQVLALHNAMAAL